MSASDNRQSTNNRNGRRTGNGGREFPPFTDARVASDPALKGTAIGEHLQSGARTYWSTIGNPMLRVVRGSRGNASMRRTAGCRGAMFPHITRTSGQNADSLQGEAETGNGSAAVGARGTGSVCVRVWGVSTTGCREQGLPAPAGISGMPTTTMRSVMYSHRYIQFRFRIGSGESNVAMFLLLLSVLLVTMLFSACTDTPPADPVIEPPPPVQRDTTSHDFVWEVDTIGLPFGMINDVSIVSENDIWVVGQFDQMGDDGQIDYSKRSNSAHWNGKTWTFHRAIDTAYQSCAGLDKVFAVNSSNVWFMAGNGRYWDGLRYHLVDLYNAGFPMSVNGLWISPDLNTRVFVGNDNGVAFWDRGRYVRPFSPPIGHFSDVRGLSNGDVAIGVRALDGTYSEIYKMNNVGFFERLGAFSGEKITHLYCGDSIMFSTAHDVFKTWGNKRHAVFSTESFVKAFEANGMNDYFILTFPLQLHHYNGSTFKEIGPTYSSFFRAFGMDVKGDIVAFVGDGPEQRSLIFRGKRR